jgi:hypothetical protein
MSGKARSVTPYLVFATEVRRSIVEQNKAKSGDHKNFFSAIDKAVLSSLSVLPLYSIFI